MGLDISHGCWRGAYTAFNRWRHKLAELAGIPLPLMVGYYVAPREDLLDWVRPRKGGPLCKDSRGPALLHWIEDVMPSLPLSWDPWDDDPLVVLLDHSDCDGEIAPEDCNLLADRLEQLLPQLAELEDDQGHIGDWREKTQRFITGLRAAAVAGEAVEFR